MKVLNTRAADSDTEAGVEAAALDWAISYAASAEAVGSPPYWQGQMMWADGDRGREMLSLLE